MQENKATEDKFSEKQLKAIKAIEGAKQATSKAKEKALELKKLTATIVDEKQKEASQKTFEELKSDYLKKVETEKELRIKGAQLGKDENNYLPEEKERGLFHVELDKPSFNQKTGKKISVSFVQKFTTADWNAYKKHSDGLGYEEEIVWNPEIYNS